MSQSDKQADLAVMRAGYAVKHILEAIDQSRSELKTLHGVTPEDRDDLQNAEAWLVRSLNYIAHAAQAAMAPGIRRECGPKRRKLDVGTDSFATMAGTPYRAWSTADVRRHYRATTGAIRALLGGAKNAAPGEHEALRKTRRQLAIELLLRKEKLVTRRPKARV